MRQRKAVTWSRHQLVSDVTSLFTLRTFDCCRLLLLHAACQMRYVSTSSLNEVCGALKLCGLTVLEFRTKKKEDGKKKTSNLVVFALRFRVLPHFQSVGVERFLCRGGGGVCGFRFFALYSTSYAILSRLACTVRQRAAKNRKKMGAASRTLRKRCMLCSH